MHTEKSLFPCNKIDLPIYCHHKSEWWIGKGYCSAPASPACLRPDFESEPHSHTGTCFHQMVCLQGMKTRRWEDISVCVVHVTPVFASLSFSRPLLFYLSLLPPHLPVLLRLFMLLRWFICVIVEHKCRLYIVKIQ